MPYIPIQRRDTIAHGERPQTAGELNYLVTMETLRYLDEHGLSYQTINDILGALEGAKQEFYRRVAIPFEDHKIATNGDVY